MPAWLTAKVLAWIAGVLGVAVLGLGAVLWAQGVQVGHLENQRDAANLKLGEAKKTIKGQIALLTECDRATNALKTESDKKVAAADQALAAARKEATRYQQANRQRDAALKAPTPSGAGCSQAIATIRPELRK
jgi:hypothetical protein